VNHACTSPLSREKIRRSTNAEDIRHSKHSKYVKPYVYPHEPEVPPMMAIENVRIRLQELVCGPKRTELAIVRRARICHVTTKIIDVLAQVLLTGLTRRRVDEYVFDGCAGDLRPTSRLANKTFNNVCVRRYTVHPLPPPKVLVRLQYAVEGDDEAEEEAKQLRSDCRVR